MTEEQIKKLKYIKEEIKEGAYSILLKNQWEGFERELSDFGAVLLKEIEQKRNDTRKLKVSLFC